VGAAAGVAATHRSVHFGRGEGAVSGDGVGGDGVGCRPAKRPAGAAALTRQRSDGAGGGGGAVLDAQLDENLLEMLVDRARADVEDFSDLAVGFTAAQPEEHFRFAAGELQRLLQELLVAAGGYFGEAE